MFKDEQWTEYKAGEIEFEILIAGLVVNHIHQHSLAN